MISYPKLFVLMPPNLHDEEQSYAHYNLTDQEPYTFGAKKDKLPQSSTIGFGGMQIEGWDESTFMFDMHSDHATPTVASETSQIRAPFELEIKIKKLSIAQWLRMPKNRPQSGRHPVQFVLTYFNGEQWISTRSSHDLILPSWYQRHTLATWIVGVIIGLVGIMVAALQLAAAMIALNDAT